MCPTGRPDRMSHRKWRESKQQPSRARSAWSGNQLSCCLVSLHFLCDILSGRPVIRTSRTRLSSTSNADTVSTVASFTKSESRLNIMKAVIAPARRRRWLSSLVVENGTQPSAPAPSLTTNISLPIKSIRISIVFLVFWRRAADLPLPPPNHRFECG